MRGTGFSGALFHEARIWLPLTYLNEIICKMRSVISKEQVWGLDPEALVQVHCEARSSCLFKASVWFFCSCWVEIFTFLYEMFITATQKCLE